MEPDPEEDLVKAVRERVKYLKTDFVEKLRSDEALAEQAAEAIVDKMIDDLIVEITSDVHRSYKMGYSELYSSQQGPDSSVPENEVVFPETVMDINCVKCQKRMHPGIFVKHIAKKCKSSNLDDSEDSQPTRASYRLASQRINTNSTSNDCSFGNGSDEEEDLKSSPEKNKNVKKSNGKRKKDPVRKGKPCKMERPKGSRESNGTPNQKKTCLTPAAKPPKDSPKSIEPTEIWISPSKINLSEDKVLIFPSKSSSGVKSNPVNKCPVGRTVKSNRNSEVRKLFTSSGGGETSSSMEMAVDIDSPDQSKNVIRNFSSLNLISSPTSASKKKDRKSKV